LQAAETALKNSLSLTKVAEAFDEILKAGQISQPKAAGKKGKAEGFVPPVPKAIMGAGPDPHKWGLSGTHGLVPSTPPCAGGGFGGGCKGGAFGEGGGKGGAFGEGWGKGGASGGGGGGVLFGGGGGKGGWGMPNEWPQLFGEPAGTPGDAWGCIPGSAPITPGAFSSASHWMGGSLGGSFGAFGGGGSGAGSSGSGFGGGGSGCGSSGSGGWGCGSSSSGSGSGGWKPF